MTDTEIPPRIIPRKCGGVLAISGVGDTLQIGVVAPTEVEATEKFWAAYRSSAALIDAERAAQAADM